MRDIMFFNFINISDFLYGLNHLLWEKYYNYLLTITRGDRFASCENIVSRSQTSSLPPLIWCYDAFSVTKYVILTSQ